MKKLIILLALLCTSAQGTDTWTAQDTQRQAIFTSLMVLDDRLTMDIVHHAQEEKNPLLGKHPGNAQIHQYFVAGALIHYAISASLPSNLRAMWQQAGIAIEVGATANNFNVGLGLHF
jgi:hypothetical protein